MCKVPVLRTVHVTSVAAHLTLVRENFPTHQQRVYGELHLIRPISIELLYTTNFVAYTALF